MTYTPLTPEPDGEYRLTKENVAHMDAGILVGASGGFQTSPLIDLWLSGQTLADDFERTGTFAGSDSSSGHTWAVTGTGSFALSGGMLTVNTAGNAYAQMELDSTPVEIGGIVSWVTGGGAAASNATLICGDSTLMTGTPSTWNALHFTMDNTGWYMQIVQAGTFTTLANGTLSGLIGAAGVTVWMQISGNTVTFQAPDGVQRTVTDSRIGSLVNKYVIYELGNPSGGPLVRWESVYAKETRSLYAQVQNLLGATKRFRSTLRANRILLDRGVGFGDTLTNLYVSATNNLKTDAVLNAALGFSGLNLTVSQNVKSAKSTITYAASMTPNFSTGQYQTINASNGTAFTINAPTNPPSSAQTSDLTIEIQNSSGGALGAITWDAVFVGGFTFTAPANTKKRAIHFRWNGASWVYVNQSGDF